MLVNKKYVQTRRLFTKNKGDKNDKKKENEIHFLRWIPPYSSWDNGGDDIAVDMQDISIVSPLGIKSCSSNLICYHWHYKEFIVKSILLSRLCINSFLSFLSILSNKCSWGEASQDGMADCTHRKLFSITRELSTLEYTK
jgi:hypothetical protein